MIIDGIEEINTEIVGTSAFQSTTKLKKVVLKTTYPPFSIERIFKGLDDLSAWREEIKAGNLVKRNITIILMDAAFRVVRKAVIVNAWPSASNTAGFSTTSSGPVTETFTFKAESITEINE